MDFISSDALVHSSLDFSVGGETTRGRHSCSMCPFDTRFFLSGFRLIMAMSALPSVEVVRASSAEHLVIEVALGSGLSHLVKVVHVQLRINPWNTCRTKEE